MKTFSAVATLLFILVLSCTQPPDYPDEPVITFERTSRDSMIQGSQNQDSITIHFSYTDGDGDLGNEDETFDVFVRDSRFPELDYATFILPFIPPRGTGNGISGEVSLVVFTSCCIFPPGTFPACDNPAEFPRDTLQFEIFILDRSGNESNHIMTDDIILRCL